MKRIILLLCLIMAFAMISNVSASDNITDTVPIEFEELTVRNYAPSQGYSSIIGYEPQVYTQNQTDISSEVNLKTYATVNPNKTNPNITVSVVNRTQDGNATLLIKSNENITGNIIFSFLKDKSFNLTDSKLSYQFSNLSKGSYDFAVYYTGDENFANATYMTSFDIPSFTSSLIIENDNITMYYNNGTRFIASLYDDLNRPLTNREVLLLINGKYYTKTTNNQGIIFSNLKLNPGNYTVEAIYQGTRAISGNTSKANLTIYPTLSGEDITKIYKNGTQYYVKALDYQGEALVRQNILFNINGVFYNRTTDSNGVAKLNINLNQGNYIITAENPIGGYKISNNITVLPSIISKDLIKIYKNATQFIVRIIDGTGKNFENAVVTFNINGVLYTKQANASGMVKLNINLHPGKYIITTHNIEDGSKASNIIEVTPLLFTQNLVKYYKNDSRFEAKLVDNNYNGVSGEKITFDINGRQYTRTTDASGSVSIAINLNPGEYEIKTVSSQFSATNSIKVLPTLIIPENNTSEMIDDDWKTYEGYVYSVHSSEWYPVKVLDGQGKAYANQTVTFTLDGENYNSTTNNNGIATFQHVFVDRYVHLLKTTYNGYTLSQYVKMLG